MLKINIFMNGKITEKAVRSGIKEYSKRLGRFCRVNEKSGLPQELDEPTMIFLIGEGISRSQEFISSVGLSKKIDALMTGGASRVSFLLATMEEFKSMERIVAESANISVYALTRGISDKSLGMLMLYEQIYRMFKISAGEAYHK